VILAHNGIPVTFSTGHSVVWPGCCGSVSWGFEGTFHTQRLIFDRYLFRDVDYGCCRDLDAVLVNAVVTSASLETSRSEYR
jgi:hypothetical protein